MHKTKAEIEKLIKEKSGIRLDIGCGQNKQPGFVGIDYVQYGDVDIVWDIEVTPWPLPDECVLTAICSHTLEHINPHSGDKRMQGLINLLLDKEIFTKEEADHYLGQPGPAFINVMNEVWRVLKPGNQFAFVVPHAESPGFAQDPTHINMINEATMAYFDPLHPSNLYGFYRPKPWKIDRMFGEMNGTLEVVLIKRPLDKSYRGLPGSIPTDIAHENIEAEETKVTSVRMG
jgi:SAM-dependent methyltransferase